MESIQHHDHDDDVSLVMSSLMEEFVFAVIAINIRTSPSIERRASSISQFTIQKMIMKIFAQKYGAYVVLLYTVQLYIPRPIYLLIS